MTIEAKQITEGNRIIAEFMGRPYKFPRTKFSTGKAYEEIILPDYNRGWNELMPVVEKIATIVIKSNASYNSDHIPVIIIVPNGYVKINNLRDERIFVNVAVEGSLINAVWQAVVQFIQWYNTINTNIKTNQ